LPLSERPITPPHPRIAFLGPSQTIVPRAETGTFVAASPRGSSQASPTSRQRPKCKNWPIADPSQSVSALLKTGGRGRWNLTSRAGAGAAPGPALLQRMEGARRHSAGLRCVHRDGDSFLRIYFPTALPVHWMTRQGSWAIVGPYHVYICHIGPDPFTVVARMSAMTKRKPSGSGVAKPGG